MKKITKYYKLTAVQSYLQYL